MNKLLHVALREFVATVLTKGFIFGILLTPLLIGIVVVLMPMLLNQKAPKIDGELAIVDPTGEVVAEVTDYLQPAKDVRHRRWHESRQQRGQDRDRDGLTCIFSRRR